MKLHKMVLTGALVASFGFPLSAAPEYGIDIRAETELSSGDDVEVEETAGLGLWAKADLNDNYAFEAKGSMEASLIEDDSGVKGKALPDIETLLIKYTGDSLGGGSLSVSLGRTVFSDPTGLVATGTADGLDATLGSRAGSVQTLFYYTGLQDSSTSDFSMFGDDGEDNGFFGTRRVVGGLVYRTPAIFGQTLALAGYFQEDMNSSGIEEYSTEYKPEDHGPLDTQYAIVALSGSLSDRLEYTAFLSSCGGRFLYWQSDDSAIGGSSYQWVGITGWMGGLSASLSVPTLLDSTIKARFVFSSGDKDAPAVGSIGDDKTTTQFLAVSVPDLGLILSPALSNLAFSDVSVTSRPLPDRNLAVQLRALEFFRFEKGPVDISGARAESSAGWIGTEVDVLSTYELSSKWEIDFSIGLFLPAAGSSGVFESSSDYTDVRVYARLGATFSL